MSRDTNPEKSLSLLIEAQKHLDRGMHTILELVAAPMSPEQQRMLNDLGTSLAHTMTRSVVLEGSLRKEIEQGSAQMQTSFSAPKQVGKDFTPAKDSVTWWNTTEGRFTSANPLSGKDAPKPELKGPAPIIEFPEDTK